MNYIYDILLNYNEYLYDFYDWNEEDNISHIRKIPLYKINKKAMEDLKKFNISFYVNDISKIKNKTEIFQVKGVKRIPYAFLVSDNSEVIGFLCDNKGNIIKRSRLLIDEEAEVLEVVNRIDERKLNYQIKKELELYPLKARNEIEMEKYIKKNLNTIKKDDIEKLKYLYYECFNKKISNRKDIINDIEAALENDSDTVISKLYSFLKLIEVKENK